MSGPSRTTPADAEVKRLMEVYHSRRAADYDTDSGTHGLFNDAQRDAWQRLLRLVAGDTTLRVLDVGCGTGFLSLLLAEVGHQVTGVDLTAAMLAQARQKAAAGLDVRFKVGDAENLPQDDASYDLVVARHLLWTLPNPLWALRDWRRVARPGGWLAIIDGEWTSELVLAEPEYEAAREKVRIGDYPSAELTGLIEQACWQVNGVEQLDDLALWAGSLRGVRYLISATNAV